MNTRLPHILSRPVSAAICLGLTATAVGQESADRGVLEEIVVTAERRSANLQDVPIAISAFSQDDLDNAGITDLETVQASVPNLQFTATGNFSAGPVVTLRGIGTDAVITGADPGVALHIDGVYMGRGSAGLLSFYDLERLEVLRGPQGTLYGRNATGGSINVISAKPTSEFEAFGDVSVGNYNGYRVRGVVGGGISDRVAGRLTATWEQRDGFLENLAPGGEDANDADDLSLRGQLRFDVGDNVEILAAAHYAETGGVGTISRRRTTPAAVAVGLVQPPPLAGTPFGVPNFQDVFGATAPLPDSLYEYRANDPQGLDQEASGANVTITWDLEAVTIKSLTGWFSNKTDIRRDGDNSELSLFTKRRVEDASQFSQEFTIASNSSGPFEWLVGAFYFEEEVDDKDTEIRGVPNPGIPGRTGTLFSFDSTVESTSWAVFGQASYYFTDAIRATLGLRYSEDEKEGVTRFRTIEDLTNGLTLIGFPQMGSYGDTWSEPTGKLGLDYFVTDDSMLYASVSRGYKAGGVNINEPSQPLFEPERIIAWEIGSKNRLLDNSLELNVSAFYYDYDDLQVFSVTQATTLIENAARSDILGLEIETKYQPTSTLMLDLAVSVLDTEIKEFVTADPADPPPLQTLEDLSGNRLARSPELEASVGIAKDWSVRNGVLTLSGRYHWQDEMFFRPQNDADKRQDAFGMLDARLTWTSNDGRWRISAFGRNLTDEEAITNLLIEAGLLGSSVLVVPNNPRTYGIEVGFRY